MRTEIAKVCAVCRFTPFKNVNSKTGKCKTINTHVLQISTCDNFQNDPRKVSKRLGGLKTAQTLAERKELNLYGKQNN